MTTVRPVHQDGPTRAALRAIAQEAAVLAADLAALEAEIGAIPHEQPALLAALTSLTPEPEGPDANVIPLRAKHTNLRAVA